MNNLLSGITKFWWIPLLTGLVSIGLGLWCIICPVTSIPVMAYIFAAFFCVAGLVNAIYGIGNVKVAPNWGWSLALGLLELAAGIWLFTLPEATLATTFVIVLGVWLIVASINAICETVVLSSNSAAWTVLSVLLLIVTIVFAFFFISSPIATAIVGWLYLGISLITFGVFRMCISGRICAINRAVRRI